MFLHVDDSTDPPNADKEDDDDDEEEEDGDDEYGDNSIDFCFCFCLPWSKLLRDDDVDGAKA